MKKMKRNLTFVSLLAVLVMAMGFASAFGIIETVEFNGVVLGPSSVIAVSPGEVVPVWVRFDATEDASDVTLEVEIKGRNGVSVSKELSDIENGSTYPSLLKLKLPETDDLSEEFTLYVTMSSSTDEVVGTFDVSVKVQKESYNLKVLSVDYNSKVEAGNAFPVSVVMKNTGYNRADDVYVIASIPALGITTRGYAGDLIPMEDLEGVAFEDEEDSVEKIVYLQIPADAESAVYEMTIEVYNKDSNTEISKLIAVSGVTPVADGDVAVLDDDSKPVSTSVVALTVILAIIFVVLLAVLVVLLTKKEKPIEEVETSYY